MRFGLRRGVTLAILLVAGLASAPSVRADLFHTIPRETPAMNLNTGEPYYAPPIPYGHYAKDYAGCIHGAAGHALGAAHGLAAKLCGLCKKCGSCGGPGCGACGGLGHHRGKACGTCGGDGCANSACGNGLGGGLFHHGDGAGHGGLFRHGAGDPCADGSCGHGGKGLFGGHKSRGAAPLCGPGQSCATPQGGAASPQAGAIPSGQSSIVTACGGCAGKGCGSCGGTGFLRRLACGLCGGHGRNGGGAACGGCGGLGFLNGGLGHGGLGLGHGDGSGLGHGGKGACRHCGGKGCALCGKLRSMLGMPLGLASGLLHKHDVQYFVGPGGPVPLTPGYVPYVNPVRSPRDYFAFPPFSDALP